jgi:OFA family oxalate/formate antiporter-like MFS transporter
MIALGGILVGLGWVGAGRAATIMELIVLYTIGGVGAGAVYAGSVGNALKWFPDHRGLCVGLTAGAYGVGTALTVAPIAKMIRASGYSHTLVVWGAVQGLVVMVAAMFMVRPPACWLPPGWSEKEAQAKQKVRMSAVDLTPLQMVHTGSFWIIYVMMTLMAFSGLVVTAQLAPIARFYKVDKVVVAFGMTALVLAIEIDRVLNGITRPFWGWVSDHLGRENTMCIAFATQAITVWALLQLIHRPVWFIVLSGFCFFSWGEIFSLFPSIVGDLFGRKWATTNYGIVYTGKGLASIFAGPIAALASVETGSWVGVFWAMIICSVIAALMAVFWLKPAAGRTIAQAQVMGLADSPRKTQGAA